MKRRDKLPTGRDNVLLMQCHRQVRGKGKMTGGVAGKGEVLTLQRRSGKVSGMYT